MSRTAGPAGAPTLLLIPGLLNDATVWAAQQRALSAQTRVLVVARTGHETSLEAMAATVLASASGPLALVGHSMGGRIALEACRQAPQRVVGLALLDTGYRALAAGAEGESEVSRRLALLHLARERGMRAMLTEWIRGMVAPQRLADATLVETIVAMMARSSSQDFERQVEALLARPDARDVLESFVGPALVACGELDGWSPPAQHRQMATLLADARLEILSGSGHMAPMEVPDAVSAILLAWWRRVVGR